MTSNIKIILEIATFIRDENLKGKERVPSSDTLVKKFMVHYNLSEDQIKKYILQLKETHYIFIINSVMPDSSLFVQGMDSYVCAEQSVLSELKHFAEQKLIQIYEATYYKRKTGHQISKELYHRIKELNNTALGKALIENTMIEDFLRQIAANAFEYTESWKKEKLYKLYRDEEEPSGHGTVDSNYSTITQKDNSSNKWTKSVNQFSIPFLIRIHFRKYEFILIKKMIISGKINQLNDLIYIRNLLKDIEKNTEQDILLKYHLDSIIELRRIAQAKINIMRKSEIPNAS